MTGFEDDDGLDWLVNEDFDDQPRRRRKGVVFLDPIRLPNGGVNLGKHERSIHKHLAQGTDSWVLVRVRKKRYVTMLHLAGHYEKPKRWAVLLRDFAIQEGFITMTEWRASFRGRGRPGKKRPRGPYKKREQPTV